MALIDEPRSCAHFHDRNTGLLQQSFGTLYAAPNNILVRAYTHALREELGKIVGTHARHFGHCKKRQIFVQLIFNVLKHAMEAFFGQTASISREPRRKCRVALRHVEGKRLRHRFGKKRTEMNPRLKLNLKRSHQIL